jgi:hypothetical protein
MHSRVSSHDQSPAPSRPSVVNFIRLLMFGAAFAGLLYSGITTGHPFNLVTAILGGATVFGFAGPVFRTVIKPLWRSGFTVPAVLTLAAVGGSMPFLFGLARFTLFWIVALGLAAFLAVIYWLNVRLVRRENRAEHQPRFTYS